MTGDGTAAHRVVRFTPTTQPDLRIKAGLTGAFVGDDVYNTTGADQTRRLTVRPATTATFVVWVQDDARVSDVLRLRGTTASSAFRVRYSVDGAGRTAAIGAGTYLTPTLEPGATHAVRIDVTAGANAHAGDALDATLTATSTTDTARKDRVRFVTNVR